MRFHAFLEEEYSVKPLEELRAMEAGCLPVDANFILEHELLQVIEAIRTSSLIPDQQRRIAELLILLSVRTGLRHNESYWLRPCDFDFGSICMLVVQPYELRKLKTRNALRRLNLTALFLPDEIHCLRAFVSAHQHAPMAPMFQSRPGEGMLDEDDLFASIHSILRDTLGDQRLRYHHGRHSMGSLLTIHLLSESTGFYGSLFPSHPGTFARLRKSRQIREGLYGHGRTGVQISALDGLSDQIGHGNPKFTLTHYVHTLGFWAAAELTNSPEFESDSTTLIAAWHKHTKSIYRYAQKGDEYIPNELFLLRFKAQLQSVSRQRKQRAKAAPHPPPATTLQKSLAALPLAAESRSEDEFREVVGDPAIVDAITTALRKSEKKR